MSATSNDILDRLPHRPPFRFLTEVITMQPGESGRAHWQVRGDEWFLIGHFPGQPIVPGVIVTEALAQLSGLVAMHPIEPSDQITTDIAQVQGRLGHVDVRFELAVAPPAKIILDSRLVRTLGGLYQFEVKASLAGQSVARGMLTLAAISQARPRCASSAEIGQSR